MINDALFWNADKTNEAPCFVTVDPSMGKCGLAVARPSEPLERLVRASGVAIAPERASDADRVAAIGGILKKICREWRVTFIVIETPTSLFVKKGRSMEALKVLLPIGGVYGAAGVLDIPVHGISVREWKGSGKQFKEHSIALAEGLWPDWQAVTDDEAEARLLALSVVQPDEVRMAYGLLKINAPMDKVLGAFHREWSWGPRELDRVVKLGEANRLTGHLPRPGSLDR